MGLDFAKKPAQGTTSLVLPGAGCAYVPTFKVVVGYTEHLTESNWFLSLNRPLCQHVAKTIIRDQGSYVLRGFRLNCLAQSKIEITHHVASTVEMKSIIYHYIL